MRKNNQYYIRKAHRYLGLITAIQFLFWTISGLYFSWTDIDEIHGDHFHAEEMHHAVDGMSTFHQLDFSLQVHAMELQFVNHKPYFWVNDSILIDAKTGAIKAEIAKEEAIEIAQNHIKSDFEVTDATYLTAVDAHHEYRGRPLPAWAVQFNGDDNVIAYIDARNGSFQRVRHTAWRYFDFLWMFHTMDYQGRDDFNNVLLRAFSLLGLITVLSGMVLFGVTFKRKRKRKK
jgi:hypothetical protein